MLARSEGEDVDAHLRLKAARKLGIAEVPVLLCDEWTPAQVKAFRLMVKRSVSRADWDEERPNTAPPLPDHPASRAADLWLCGNLRRRNSC